MVRGAVYGPVTDRQRATTRLVRRSSERTPMRPGRRPRGDGQRALRAIPLFQRCTDAELQRVERLVDQIDGAAGEVVTSERDAPSESYVIVSGDASLVVRERSVGRLAAGDVFGELAPPWSRRPPASTG